MWKSSSGRSFCWKKQLEGMDMVWKTKPYKRWCLHDLPLALRNHPSHGYNSVFFPPPRLLLSDKPCVIGSCSFLFIPEKNGDLDWCSVKILYNTILVLFGAWLEFR